MLDNLFHSWRKPDDENPVKIGDKIRFKARTGVMCEATVEFLGMRDIGVLVTKYDHWGYDIGELVTVDELFIRVEVYR